MKYYYDCPYKAGFMNQYHNIQYQKKDPIDGEFIDFIPADYDDFRICSDETRLYVHPDSLYILEAQKGDLLDEIGGVISTGKVTFPRPSYMKSKIIQRNNIPFMTPEVEHE